MPKKKAKPSPTADSLTPWLQLTTDDLAGWAGDKTFSRGFNYHAEGAVFDVALLGDFIALGWVEGTETYATRVTLRPKTGRRRAVLTGECTCPVGEDCKHAVALTLACVQAASHKRRPPAVDELDPRLELFGGVVTRGRLKSAPAKDEGLRSLLEAKPIGELVDLLMSVARRDDELKSRLRAEQAKQSGDWSGLLKQTRKEMRRLTSEEAWSNGWTGARSIPEYGELKRRLEDLLASGCVDPLIDLGKELFKRGTAQVERSDDEGETSYEVASCLDVIAEALPLSTLSPDKKLSLAVDFLLDDSYGLCEGFYTVVDSVQGKAAWSMVADSLLERLEAEPQLSGRFESFSQSFARCRLSDWVIRSLDSAGRRDEATRVCLDEATQSGEHVRAVDRMIKLKRHDEAKEIALLGLRETPAQYGGVVRNLNERLKTIATTARDWPAAAAIEADDFFRSPDLPAYKRLLKAAKKAKCEASVRSAARSFLETGLRPDADRRSARAAVKGWPLPEPIRSDAEEPHSPSSSPGPHYSVLIEMAIKAKDADQTLRWHSQKKTGRANSPPHFLRTSHTEDLRVAKAVEVKHPDQAAAIHAQVAEDHARTKSTKVYPDAVKQLKEVRRILLRRDLADYWESLLQDFCHKHHRKYRLMELVDNAGLRR